MHTWNVFSRLGGSFVLLMISALLFLSGCQENNSESATLASGTPEAAGPLDVITQIVRQTRVVTPTATPGSSRDPVELDLGYTGGFPNIDPQTAVDQNSLNLVENIFAGLTNFNHNSNQVEPELAKGWTSQRRRPGVDL
jgi:ABC-type transport system substrate-binding protein